MDAARWTRLMQLFDEARGLDASARVVILNLQCRDDLEMRRELQSLLDADADAEASGFLDSPASSLLPRIEAALGDTYRVERELGGGGMSRVFLASDMRLSRRVVVKVLPPELGAALDIERFRREVRLAAGLRHPHIVPLLTAEESPDGLLYYTMPFIEGESLRHRLDREGALSSADVVRITHEVADALSYAHRRGVVHRDIKPENVLVDGSHVVVSDFGIAKAISVASESTPSGSETFQTTADDPSQSVSLTARGLIVGTPSYMSPEQARGSDGVDVRSDIYSLGCLAFEMLTGERPAPIGASDVAARCPTITCRRSGLDSSVDRVIARAMATRPEFRFETAEAFARALESALTARPVAGPLTSPAGGHKHSRIRQLTIGSVAALLLVVTLVFARGHWFNLQPRPASPPTLAILPFRNIGAPDDQYFADGVAEEIGTRLSRVAGLRVIAWTGTSGLRAEGKSTLDIGRAVGASYVLDGSVRWAREPNTHGSIRITPRLVRVSDSAQIWGDTYDSDVANLLRIQGSVAERVASALNVALAGRERAEALARGTTNAEAYDEYLRGNALSVGRFRYDRASRLEALRHYERAVALDPTFASAWARLARANHLESAYGPDTVALTRARAAAERAFALDSTLADANLAMGELDDRPWRAAERYLFALRSNPNNDELHWAVGNAQMALGLRDDAVASYEAAAALNPRNPTWFAALADAYDNRREFAAAIQARVKQIALDSTNSVSFLAQSLSYLNSGDTASARRTLRRAVIATSRARLVQVFALRSGLRTLRVLWPFLDDETRQAFDTLSHSASDSRPWVIHAVKGTHFDMANRSSAMRAEFDSARAGLESEIRLHPSDPGLHEELGVAMAALGIRDSALAEGNRAVRLDSLPGGAAHQAWRRFTLAMIAARFGDANTALDALSTGLPDETPVVTLNWLRLDPIWDPIRADRRYQQMLNSPRF